jgi:chromate reductase
MNENALNIIAISGSLRPHSSNMAILKNIGPLFPAEVTFSFYHGLADLPHFNPEIDNAGTPASVNEFRNVLREADGIIICTPEYAFGVPGTLKNALDWTVSTDIFSDKPVAVITASSLGDKAHASLLLTFKALSANIAEGTSLLIPYVRTKVSSAGEITDPTTWKQLQDLVVSFTVSVQHGNKKIPG